MAGIKLILLKLFLAQLDGVSKKAIKRLADHHSNINDWLELSDDSITGALDKNGKKRVSFEKCMINQNKFQFPC